MCAGLSNQTIKWRFRFVVYLCMFLIMACWNCLAGSLKTFDHIQLPRNHFLWTSKLFKKKKASAAAEGSCCQASLWLCIIISEPSHVRMHVRASTHLFIVHPLIQDESTLFARVSVGLMELCCVCFSGVRTLRMPCCDLVVSGRFPSTVSLSLLGLLWGKLEPVKLNTPPCILSCGELAEAAPSQSFFYCRGCFGFCLFVHSPAFKTFGQTAERIFFITRWKLLS